MKRTIVALVLAGAALAAVPVVIGTPMAQAHPCSPEPVCHEFDWAEPYLDAFERPNWAAGSRYIVALGGHPSRGRTVRTRVMNTPNASMKSRRNCSVVLSVTSPSSVISPGVNWM